MNSQLAFSHLLAEADERARATRDLHRGRVQAFFDALSPEQKSLLGEWMVSAEWDTCASLSVAACDWKHSQLNGVRNRASEVPPVWWTPEHLCSRSPQWQERTHLTRRSSGVR